VCERDSVAPMKLRAALVIPFVALFAACSDTSSGTDASPTPDVIADTSATDTSATDTSATDTSATDTSASDATRPDVTVTDVTISDVTAPDVTTPDASRPDVTPVDVAPSDAPQPPADASRPDASPADVPTADVPPSDGGCTRPSVSVLPSRTSCEGGAACPTGYTCMSLSGIVLQRFCGRACRVDCDCPATQSCGSYSDKAGTHPLCVSP
jgi:hypothetical protein